MNNFQNDQPRMFEAFIKSAQYIVRLGKQQDIWEHLGKFITTYFPAAWTALVQRDAAGGLSLLDCTLPCATPSERLLTSEMRALIADVLDSGFLASRVLPIPALSMTAVLPLVEGSQASKAILIGHETAEALSNELLNIYLALAGLAGATLDRLENERELDRHRAHLEELVKERTAELVKAKRQNEQILHSVGDGVCGMDMDGRITFVSPSAALILGWEPGDLIGRNAHATFHHVQPDGGAYLAQDCPILSTLNDGQTKNATNEMFVRKDGTPIPVEFMTTPIMEAARIVGAVMVFRDITERKRADEAVREVNAQLREADRRKDEFLAMLAHELRNPLAPVRYAVQILNAPGLTEKVRQRHQGIIDRQVTHMARLLDDLLDVSRVTRGKVELRCQPIFLIDVLAHAADTARPMCEVRCQYLHFVPPPTGLRVEADSDRLTQVVGNLLVNAAKFTGEGGRIWLEAVREREQAVIRVRDTGIGIATEFLPHVFDLFVQADDPRHRSQGGLGIGLTLVKRLVEMHGGTVEVCSEGECLGSEFIIRLPALPEKAIVEPASRTVALKAVGNQGLRILVVDDIVDSASSLAELLALWGHEARAVHDGLSAIETVRAWRPEMVLLDIGMPGMDGYETARRLREEHGRQGLTLVALTGFGQETDREAAREAGFDSHLVKPVEIGALRDLLVRE